MFIKLKIQSLVLAGLFALIAGPALALTATDSDRIGLSDLGYVEAGSTLEYDHTFDPYFDDNVQIDSINSAWLYVAIVDDWDCAAFGDCLEDWFLESETAVIDLNSVSWATGAATAAIFWGDVTAEADLLNTEGTLHVSISSSDGDFAVLGSWLLTNYDYELGDFGLVGTLGGGEGTGAEPMPEPSAALVFAIGALVMRGTIRRRQAG